MLIKFPQAYRRLQLLTIFTLRLQIFLKFIVVISCWNHFKFSSSKEHLKLIFIKLNYITTIKIKKQNVKAIKFNNSNYFMITINYSINLVILIFVTFKILLNQLQIKFVIFRFLFTYFNFFTIQFNFNLVSFKCVY